MDYTLAIIGSRNMKSQQHHQHQELFIQGITQVLEKYGQPSTVVSGGAKGADTIGENWANDNNIKCVVYKPDWKKLGKRAGIVRNYDIIKDADHVLAFPSRHGKGTQHSISIAKKANKDVIQIYID